MINFSQLDALIKDETDQIAILANTSAFLNDSLDQINWVGFYLMKNDELVLGPFQGHPACTHIALNRGVCGKAATTKMTQRIPDVHQFPGHIACDANSRSELVVPIIKDDQVIGVLDIDAPVVNRFTETDQQDMEQVAQLLIQYL